MGRAHASALGELAATRASTGSFTGSLPLRSGGAADLDPRRTRPTFPYVQYHPMEAGGRIAQAQENGSRRTSSLFRHSTRWSRNELTRPDNLPRTRLPTGGNCFDEYLIHSTTVWRYEAGRGRRVRLASEPAGRRGISVYRGREHGTASRRREQLHIDFPEGSHTANGRLLVRGGYPYCGYYPYPPC
jgi:hypothetical protein